MGFLRSFAAAALLVWAPFVFPATAIERSGGPFVPTPPAVVEAMLQLAGVGENDYVVDLGSGDGRIVLTAARLFRARGLGVEIDPELVHASNVAARREGLSDRVSFVQRDVREADLSRATVLTLYLLPGMMDLLRDKVLREMRPGARVVSHDFIFDHWRPDRTERIETTEKYDSTGHWTSDLYLWIVPAKVEGSWRGTVDGETLELDLRQRYQRFRGTLRTGGREVAFDSGRIEGTRITFEVPGPGGGFLRYTATIGPEGLSGQVLDGEAPVGRWSAVRRS